MSMNAFTVTSPSPSPVAAARPRVYTFQRFALRVVDGPDAGVERSSDREEVELGVGTGAGNQLVLTDGSVSRRHLSVTATPHGLRLRDLGSTNGTWIGDCRIETAWVAPGQRISLGDTTIEVMALGEEVALPLASDDRWGPLVGASVAARRLFEILPRVAAGESSVLIEGEPGTGKGVLARAIHDAGARAGQPFVTVSCGSVPRSLMESELFGHEKGAFAGAVHPRVGALTAASGGTLFLDEIGELPLDLQPALLRAIEQRVVKPAGGSELVRLDVRVIAATHRDLRTEVNRGGFRSDLLHRLSGVGLRLAPLRERPEDVALLASCFWAELRGHRGVPTELMEAWVKREWPGNVRELRNAVEVAATLGELDGKPRPSIPPPPRSLPAPELGDASLTYRVAKERGVSRWEREFVKNLLRRNGGSITGSARAARMDRNHLRDLVRRHGVTGNEQD